VNLCCRNVKNDRFVSIRYVFQALKYAKIRFLPGLCPGPHWGSLRRSPDPLVGWGGGNPLPIPFPLLSQRPSVVWPPTSLKFVHLAQWPSGQKGWTPLIYNNTVMGHDDFTLKCIKNAIGGQASEPCLAGVFRGALCMSPFGGKKLY